MHIPHRAITAGILACILALTAAFFIGQTAAAQTQGTPCHLLTSANPIPAGFGAGFNVISTARELLLRASRTASGANISVGNDTNPQYIYKTGYEWRNNAWREITFQGGDLVGDAWHIGEARATLSRTAQEMAEPNFFVAYVCTWTGLEWKCGCRDSACTENLWQLQPFRHEGPLPAPGAGAVTGQALNLQSQFPNLYDENLPYNGLFYGYALSADAFHPVRVGRPEQEVSMRFRAERSGTITSVTFNSRYNRGNETAYSSSNGGRVHAQLRTDDGTSKHWPTTTVLGRTNSAVPTSFGHWATLNFQSPVSVQAGQLYHMVLVQETSSFFSVNGMAISSRIDPIGGPYYGDDFFFLMKDGNQWRRASADARRPKYVMPYMSLCYSGGECVGHGGGWTVNSNRFTIGGNNRARQTFTIAGPTRRTTGVWFRVARTSSSISAPLVFELKQGNSVVFSRFIPASQIDVGDIHDAAVTDQPVDWIYVEFPNVIPLQSSTSYIAELRSTASNAYQIKGHHDPDRLLPVGDRNAWQDDRDGARGQVSTNGGSSWSNTINSGSIDFTFLFTLEGGPRSIQSVAGPQGILD